MYFSLFRVMALLFVVGGIALFLPGMPVDSASNANESIRIFPSTPAFYQPFFVTVSGQWADTCIPAFHSLNISGSEILLEARTPDSSIACKDEQTPWGLSVLVQPQLPYFYTARLSIVSGITGRVISTTSHEFDVSGGIHPDPALPQTGQEVSLRLADFSPDGCIPQYVDHTTNGTAISVESQIPNVVCGQVPTPWEMNIALGALAAGNYQVELHVTDHRHTPPQRSQLLSGSFQVVSRILYSYLPLWGCFGGDPPSGGCAIFPEQTVQGAAP